MTKMANKGAKIVYGTAGVARFNDSNEMLEVCRKHGIKELDTAYAYVCPTGPLNLLGFMLTDMNREAAKRHSTSSEQRRASSSYKRRRLWERN
jgi:hypothetical protein